MKLSEKYRSMGIPEAIITQLEALEEWKEELRQQDDRLDSLVAVEHKKLQEYQLSVEGQITKIRNLNTLLESGEKENLLEVEKNFRHVLWELGKKFEYKLERAYIRLQKKREEEETARDE